MAGVKDGPVSEALPTERALAAPAAAPSIALAAEVVTAWGLRLETQYSTMQKVDQPAEPSVLIRSDF